jgi:hypothetical protein
MVDGDGGAGSAVTVETMRKPEFVTFTGADDQTDVDAMRELAKVYPVEWGILFNPARQGKDNRFPGEAARTRLVGSGLRLCAHLCGALSRAIMDGRPVEIPVDLAMFSRVQINHAKPNLARVTRFQNGRPRCIAQTRAGVFPEDAAIDWLFDTSGGRGREPGEWPPYPGRMVGYSGGIGPENVASVIEQIAADGPYWIDMESKVRTDDWFDLSLCRQVCEIVYDGAQP